MGTELIPEKKKNLQILTQLSARENFSFKTDEDIVPTDALPRMSAYDFKIELFRGILETRKAYGGMSAGITACPNFLNLQCRVESHIAVMYKDSLSPFYIIFCR
jgi:hypothetical protein